MSFRRLGALFIAAVVVTGSLLLLGTSAVAAPLSIAVQGNRLVNGSGQTVTLHGVNRSGSEYMCVQGSGQVFDGPSDAASVAAIASWIGVNAVRLGLNEDCWLGINGANPGGAAYQTAIENYVSLLHQYGLYAILELHWSAPGTSLATYQENLPDYDHAPAMWASVAAAFKNDPATILDLFNEPNNIGMVGCAPGAPAYCQTAITLSGEGPVWWCAYSGSGCITNQNSAKFGDWQVASMQDMLTAVRGAGASNVVMMGGDEFANDMTQWLTSVPADPLHQVAASVHIYNWNPYNSLSQWQQYLLPIAAQYPVVIGEFGGGNPWSYDQPLLQFADANGMSSLAWAWDTWAGDLITDYAGTPVQGFGTSYQAYLASLGASPTPSLTPTATPSPSSTTAGAINVEPSMRPWRYVGANPQSWWCVMPLCTSDFDVNGQGPMPTVTQELQESKALGATFVRLEFPWALIETANGVYDWSRADAIMAAAQQVGESILPVVVWTPAWAGGGAALTGVPDPTVFAAFVAALQGRYHFAYLDIGNEPDDSKYFAGTAQQYVDDLLNPAYAAIKGVSPSAQVVLAGSAGDPTGWVSTAISDGGKFDVAAFHDYSGSYAAEASQIRLALGQAGLSSTPIWMTEFGVQSSGGDQSAAITSVFGSPSDLALAAWYNLRDTGAWTCSATGCTEVVPASWGLLNADFTPKPSYGLMQGYLAGVAPSPTPSPTPTPTPTPTSAPSPTPTPTPGSSGSAVFEGGANGTSSLSLATTAGDSLVLGVLASTTSPALSSSLSDAWSKVASATHPGASNLDLTVWAAPATTGSDTITVPGATNLALAEYSGSLTADRTAAGSGYSATLSAGPTASLAESGELVTGFGALAYSGGHSLTPGSGYVMREQSLHVASLGLEDQTAASATGVTASMSALLQSWSAVVVAFGVAGSPAPSPTPTPSPTPAPIDFSGTFTINGYACNLTVVNGAVSGTCS